MDRDSVVLDLADVGEAAQLERLIDFEQTEAEIE